MPLFHKVVRDALSRRTIARSDHNMMTGGSQPPRHLEANTSVSPGYQRNSHNSLSAAGRSGTIN
ncbi:hypothetical protein [Flexivirga aerilata]|uniref:hypothetical protein n=1 Tax=Flexivirga aerilata TaxID=1656889 RepID=UPI001FE561BE|nr:hypothetical protein [Flexivirga aerilata]